MSVIVHAPVTRYFFDTEFIDRGSHVDLISIGIVCEDGRRYYAVKAGWDQLPLSAWLQQNVVPKLPWQGELSRYIRTPEQMAADLRRFVIGTYPEFWAAFAAYDWFLLCSLFGGMLQAPAHWPKNCNDTAQVVRQLGGKPQPWPVADPQLEHNALYDAFDTQKKWRRLKLALDERSNRVVTL